MNISVSSMDHLSALETLASCPNVDITLTPANVGDRLDVTFDENDEAVAKAIIAILSSELEREEDDDGSRKGRGRWIGDDAITIEEKVAMKVLKAGFGRKGISYIGAGKWIVSKEAWTAYTVFQKLQQASSKTKTNYRIR